VAVALVAIAFLLVIIAAIKSPFTQSEVSESLENTVHSKVSFEKFHTVYFPHPGCVAENVTFVRSPNTADAPPLVTVQRMAIEARYVDLIARPGYIARILLNGLHVHVPVLGASRGRLNSQPSQVRVGEIVADGATLEVDRSNDKPPLKFEIHSLVVRSYGPSNPWSYRVTMRNAEPPGEMNSDGHFGPLDLNDLGSTLLSGSYQFQQANLSMLPGIAGTLSSDGDFTGRLGDVAVRGAVDIPDFKVVTSDHEVHLNSRFRAHVNGTNGDVFLNEIDTSFLQTVVGGQGSIASKSGQKGKTTSLELEVNKGRVQDLLRLFVTANRPPMNGQTRLKAHVLIPPEGRPFLKELILQGDFGIDEAALTKPITQTRVDELSERARGEKKDKDKDKDKNEDENKTASESDADDPENVVLNLRGHVEVRDGVAKFSDLSLSAPGASARMSGSYYLLNQRIDLHGTLKTEARLSQETRGIKSALLKPFDPLFKGKKAGAEIPVKVTGTYQNPQFGFDVMGKVKPH
jgi:uncharacterized protein involved in outer membrane biogenesis